MTPDAIVAAAAASGLDMIAICDHNSAENVAAAVAAAAGLPLAVIGGMEITTAEEVHVLGLFGARGGGLEAMQSIVHENLPGRNDEAIFGEQVICGEDGAAIGRSDRLLIGATTLSIERVVEEIHRLGGIAVASHIDREGFGIIGQLGFIPDGLELDALGLSPRAAGDGEWRDVSRRSGLALVASSDAHRLSEIGAASTSLEIESASFEELKAALESRDGRRVVA